MDENENKSYVEEPVNSTKENASSAVKKVVEMIKNNKKVLIGLVVVILAIILLSSIFGGGKKGVIKDFVKATNKGNAKKMMDTIDMAGLSVYMEMLFNDDDLEDFYDEYKDFIKSDEWEDAQDDMDDYIEELEDSIEEPDDDEKLKIKKFGDVEKEGKNLWKIEVELEVDDEDIDADFYVMKKGLNYYIVGFDGIDMF